MENFLVGCVVGGLIIWVWKKNLWALINYATDRYHAWRER